MFSVGKLRGAALTIEVSSRQDKFISQCKNLMINVKSLLIFRHILAGAQASPLQCIQLADSCLALGAQSCQHAKSVLDELCSSGKLGAHAKVTI